MPSSKNASKKSAAQTEIDEIKKVLEDVERQGVKPDDDEHMFFTGFNKGNFAILPGQVVSLSIQPNESNATLDAKLTKKADAKRNTWDKLPRTTMNAGTPSGNDEDIPGEEFRGVLSKDGQELIPHGLVLSDCLTKQVQYTADVVGGKEKQITRYDETKNMDIGQHDIYSGADVLMLAMAGRMLSLSGQQAFERYACDVPYSSMNKKLPREKPVPSDDVAEEDFKERMDSWLVDQDDVRKAIKRFYLVYPEEVEPGFTSDGNVFLKGEIAMAKSDKRNPKCATFHFPVFAGAKGAKKADDIASVKNDGTVDTPDCAPQLMMRFDFYGDKTEGSPGGNVGGFHDVQRMYPIYGKNFQSVLTLLKTYELEAEFPAVVRLGKVRGSKAGDSGNGTQLNVENMHAMSVHLIGSPPDVTSTADPEFQRWLGMRASHPYARAWVRERDAKNREGIRYSTKDGSIVPAEFVEMTDGSQVEARFLLPPEDKSWEFNLVPLLQKREAECNGTTIIDLNAFGNIDAHATSSNSINNAIRVILGQKGGGGTKRKASDEEVDALQASLTEAKTSNSSLANANNTLRTQLKEAHDEISNLKKKAKTMEITTGGKHIVQISGDNDATVMVRASKGRLLHDNGTGGDMLSVQSNENGFFTMRMLFTSSKEVEADDAAYLALTDKSDDAVVMD